jgi:hypothetical protein
VSPPWLLLEQLTCAHSIFLLHHGSSLQELLLRLDRAKLCNILDKFWTKFATNWDVLLHGNPAVDIFGGIKLAAGGELGIGVGEEEWGSGEREVLEDYVRRTEGLVDILVARFGEPCHPQNETEKRRPQKEKMSAADRAPDQEPWLGSGTSPSTSDGIVFSGVTALSRNSIRDLSRWMESIHVYGEYAYGIRDNPSSDRRKRRKQQRKSPESRRVSPMTKDAPAPRDPQEPAFRQIGAEMPRAENEFGPRIPPPIVTTAETSLAKASAAVETGKVPKGSDLESTKMPLGDPETWVKYLTLGYGTGWISTKGSTSERTSPPQREENFENEPRTMSTTTSMRFIDPEPEVDDAEQRRDTQVRQENTGYFIIGLQGDMDDDDIDDANDDGNWNNRIPLRTVYVELASNDTSEGEGSITPTQEVNDEIGSGAARKRTRLRPIVYIVCFLRCAFRVGSSVLMFYIRLAPSLYIHVFVQTRHRVPCVGFFLSQPAHLFRSAPSSSQQQYIA